MEWRIRKRVRQYLHTLLLLDSDKRTNGHDEIASNAARGTFASPLDQRRVIPKSCLQVAVLPNGQVFVRRQIIRPNASQVCIRRPLKPIKTPGEIVMTAARPARGLPTVFQRLSALPDATNFVAAEGCHMPEESTPDQALLYLGSIGEWYIVGIALDGWRQGSFGGRCGYYVNPGEVSSV